MTAKKTTTTVKPLPVHKDNRFLSIEDRIEAYVHANCYNHNDSCSAKFDEDARSFTFKIDPKYARTYQNSIPFTHRVKVEGITDIVVIATLEEFDDGCQLTYIFQAETK